MKAIRFIFLTILICFPSIIISSQSIAEQLKFSRVKAAYNKHQIFIKNILKLHNANLEQYELHLQCFKAEKEIEVWIKPKAKKQFLFLYTIPICAASGTYGPKERQGDNQVPEGCYAITIYNPYSSYHLSMFIDYPNKADKSRTKTEKRGGAIYIHGNCVSIGCLAIGNEEIEKLYLLSIGGQGPATIHIYPSRQLMSSLFLENKLLNFSTKFYPFWMSLAKVYAYFQEYHQLPKLTYDAMGNYLIAD